MTRTMEIHTMRARAHTHPHKYEIKNMRDVNE